MRPGLLLCAALVAAGAAPQEQKKHKLRVLVLAEPDTARGKDLQAFFAARFAAARAADRWTWDRAVLAETDLVVVDWPQSDGISRWMLKGDKTAERACPLGARAEWTKPTLLLGSAGLNLAWAWDVKGAFG
jgi:hypothetical protein